MEAGRDEGGVGEREGESSGLREWETEPRRESEMAWVEK